MCFLPLCFSNPEGPDSSLLEVSLQLVLATPRSFVFVFAQDDSVKVPGGNTLTRQSNNFLLGGLR